MLCNCAEGLHFIAFHLLSVGYTMNQLGVYEVYTLTVTNIQCLKEELKDIIINTLTT